LSSDKSSDSDVESESSDDDGSHDDSYIDIEESSEKRKYSDPDEEKYVQKISLATLSSKKS